MNQHAKRSRHTAPEAAEKENEDRSHPVGTAVGATAGAVAGAAIGTAFGPIGTLVGAGLGAVAGGGAGGAVSEQLHPKHEEAYWREAHTDRDYYDERYDFDRDYLPAYRTGWEARGRYGLDREWDDDLEVELATGWEKGRSPSVFDWEQARHPVWDAWNRANATYRTYANTDEYFGDRYEDLNYYNPEYTFEDYRPAFRYGVYSRAGRPEAEWDERIEGELEAGWDGFRGDSRLDWEDARYAARDGWNSTQSVLPEDFNWRRP